MEKQITLTTWVYGIPANPTFFDRRRGKAVFFPMGTQVSIYRDDGEIIIVKAAKNGDAFLAPVNKAFLKFELAPT
jgi:hypothetical protein